jgi:hypothetical protein
MAEQENLGSFFKENKKLVKEYLDVRLEIYKLQFTKIFSQSAGYFIWIVISLFLLWLFIIFLGIVTGFWLSDLTGSYTKGFGLTTLIILVVILILALLRKPLFVNPIIRKIIQKANEKTNHEEE